MKNIYPLRHYSAPKPVDPACRNFWRGYIALVLLVGLAWWLK